MPTYEYECEDCGPFSELRPMAEFELPQPCPDCGKPAPRLLTLAAIGGAARENPGPAPIGRHAGGCSCCGPRRFSAEAV